jgi:hypothetical protein
MRGGLTTTLHKPAVSPTSNHPVSHADYSSAQTHTGHKGTISPLGASPRIVAYDVRLAASAPSDGWAEGFL